jgi:hypothetical protein
MATERVWTAEEIREQQAKNAAALVEMEKTRRANDRVIGIATTVDGLFALTAEGRIFKRNVDPRVTNDGRGATRFTWAEVESPLAS